MLITYYNIRVWVSDNPNFNHSGDSTGDVLD